MKTITTTKKKKNDALRNVSIVDLVNIHVHYLQPAGYFDVQIVPIDQTKMFVIDERVKATLESKITEKASAFSYQDPRAKKFIEEFTAKMIEELAKHDLCGLELVPDSPSDPYADLRRVGR